MSSNNDFFQAVYDENLVPLTGLTPSWVFFGNAVTGVAATPPAVNEVIIGGSPRGLYQIQRKLDYGVRYVGKLDFGIGAVPRYYDYDSRWEEGMLADNVALIAGLVHKNVVIDQTEFNSKGLMTAARVRVFPSKDDVVAFTNLMGTISVAVASKASPNDDKMDSFTAVLEP